MARTFMPKAHYMPVNNQYRPMYRWFVEAPYTLVPRCKPCANAGQAIAAAEAYMADQMKKQIRSSAEHEPEGTEVDQDCLGVDEWRRQREEDAAAEKQRLFGSDGPSVLYLRGGRQVQVEKRRPRP